MVSECLNEIKSNYIEKFILLDIWTGSSCIPISIINSLILTKNNFKVTKTYALDISEEALEVSNINITNHNLENLIITKKSDLLSYFFDNFYKDLKDNNFIITANLPYIKDLDYKNMDYWVISYEPKIALYWWKETWFEIYEALINQCFLLKKEYSLKKVLLFIEIWFDQIEYSKNYIENLWLKYEIFSDNNWIFRCFKINVL
jgi:methylase of polypeptide subunit release factors